ncbi:MAG: hypothetical protein SGBAC_005367 [Bacillariaceae sp.]
MIRVASWFLLLLVSVISFSCHPSAVQAASQSPVIAAVTTTSLLQQQQQQQQKKKNNNNNNEKSNNNPLPIGGKGTIPQGKAGDAIVPTRPAAGTTTTTIPITTTITTLLDVLFAPRVALKTLAVGLGCFGIELLFFPTLFRHTFLNLQGLETTTTTTTTTKIMSSTLATDFLQHLLGCREIFLSIFRWYSASKGTDEACQVLVTLAFVTLSIPQIYYILRFDVLKNSQVQRFMLGFQGFFFCLNGGATIKALLLSSDERVKRYCNNI